MNRVVIDLAKVQHARFFWKNQDGLTVNRRPPYPSVRGLHIDESIAGYHPDYPGETMRERAFRLGVIDEWKAQCEFTFAANHNVVYVGQKAISMWDAWNARIFGKKKGKK